MRLLLNKISKGDEQAFSQLFYQWYDRLKHTGNHFIKSPALVEELVQNVFLKIWLHRESLPNLENFDGYILTITKNELKNALKKSLAEKLRIQKWQLAQPAPITVTEEISDKLELIKEAIEKLPVQQKKVFVLARLEKYSREEISTQLQLSPKTVKKHLQLATRFVRLYVRTRMPDLLPLFIIFIED
jgi:RNA polymerase sigma-70 factor (family 1)